MLIISTTLMLCFTLSSSLEWKSHSILQPGSCPSSNTLLNLNVAQIIGKWNIKQLPRSFPGCCRWPTVDFTELSIQHEITNNSSQPSLAIVDVSPCRDNTFVYYQVPLNIHLWQNAFGSFLIDGLPWPFNMIGFASFNIINVDYTKYLLGFVCLQLLMEHVTIPIVMIRSLETLNSIESHRIKWTFLKQGILSAWDLTDVINEECNEVSTSFIKLQEAISIHFDQPNSTASNMTTNLLNQTDLTNIHPTTKTSLGENGILQSATTVDPDTQVEWITTTVNYVTEEYAIHFPESNFDPEIVEHFPSVSGIWPAIFMGNQITKDNSLNRTRFENYQSKTPIDDSISKTEV